MSKCSLTHVWKDKANAYPSSGTTMTSYFCTCHIFVSGDAIPYDKNYILLPKKKKKEVAK